MKRWNEESRIVHYLNLVNLSIFCKVLRQTQVLTVFGDLVARRVLLHTFFIYFEE
jgi:hypothetical protein